MDGVRPCTGASAQRLVRPRDLQYSKHDKNKQSGGVPYTTLSPNGQIILGLQRVAGNAATALWVRGAAVVSPQLTVQRQPTVDLAKLDQGTRRQSELQDFIRIQALLSNTSEALPHLRILSAALEPRLIEGTPLLTKPAQKAQFANGLLDEVLAGYEQRCGFSAQRPVLVGFASADDFKTLTKAGQHFHDVGARAGHGEFSHRIQWFIVMSAVTNGRFDGSAQEPYRHTPRELYEASMSEDFAVKANSASGRGYMWDWVFDRIRGMHPAAEGVSETYSPTQDAWTHPGGNDGALSDDLRFGKVPGLDALSGLRKHQFAGAEHNKAAMTKWFTVAQELKMAQGQAFGGGPSYFMQSLVPDDVIVVLRDGKTVVHAAILIIKHWAEQFKATGQPDLPKLTQIRDLLVKLRLRQLLDRLRNGGSPMPEVMLSGWFIRILNASSEAHREIEDTGRKEPLVALLSDLANTRSWPVGRRSSNALFIASAGHVAELRTATGSPGCLRPRELRPCTLNKAELRADLGAARRQRGAPLVQHGLVRGVHPAAPPGGGPHRGRPQPGGPPLPGPVRHPAAAPARLGPHDYRGYAGTVAGGVMRPGDEAVVLPSGYTTTIAGIETSDGPVEEAYPPMAVTVTLADHLDVSRGDMLCRPHNMAQVGSDIDAMVCWMIEGAPLKVGGRYLLKHTTRSVRAVVKNLRYRLDINTLHRDRGADSLGLNDIGRIELRTQAPLFFDEYRRNRTTGSFILIDEATNNTVGAGMIRGPVQPSPPEAEGEWRLLGHSSLGRAGVRRWRTAHEPWVLRGDIAVRFRFPCSILLMPAGFRDTVTHWRAAMKVSTMIRADPGVEPHDRLMNRMADYARRIEAERVSGHLGRRLAWPRPADLDPLIELSVFAAVTERVELGISVLQLPLRHPIELAHRVQSVQALSGNRLRLGVGSGSTRADFELLGYDYDHRFGTMKRSLETMRHAWRGEATNAGGTLSVWPECEGGPPILMGAWRSPRWITFAAQECQGWTPSGRYSSWDDLEHGMRIYREAGGTNAVLANVAVDLANRPESAALAEVTTSLVCAPDEARRRLKRIEQLGFDEVLLVSHSSVLEDIERVRDFL